MTEKLTLSGKTLSLGNRVNLGPKPGVQIEVRKKRVIMPEQKPATITTDAAQKLKLLQEAQKVAEHAKKLEEERLAKAEKERTKAARKRVETMKEKVSAPTKSPKAGSPAPSASPKVLRDFKDLRALSKSMSEMTAPAKRTGTVDIHRQRTLSFNRTLDIRGMRVDEATEALIAYMDDAVMVGAGEVTILHGTGTGALKQLTRDYLTSLNRIRHKRGQQTLDFGDGDVNHGGAGLTVVQL